MFRFGDPGGRIYTSVGTSNVNLLAYWTSYTTANAGAVAVSSSNGRSGGSSLRFSGTTNYQSYAIKTLSSQATWGVAFALRISALPGSSIAIVGFYDSSTIQIDLRINADGTLSITRNGTVLGTSSSSITSNTYYHFEWKTLIHPSAGTSELRVNGVAWIGPLSSLNTRNTANSTANQLYLGYGLNTFSGLPTLDYDDIIAWDGQSTDANGFTDIHDFIGDCGLVWLPPTGAGTTTQFTPDSGSNYARVNEATPDSDTSYVSDATVGHIDTYALTDLGGTVVTVKSVASIHFARKDDVGSRGMKAELRSASANAAYATEISLSSTYQYYFSNWGQNPNNGSAIDWTPTTVNALEAGQTVSS